MTDEFLVVVPPEWIELADSAAIVSEVGENWISGVIINETWYEIEQVLERLGVLPEGKNVIGLRMVNNGEGTIKLWAKYT